MNNLVKLGMTVGLMLMICLFSACSSDEHDFQWEGGDVFTYQGERYAAIDLSRDLFYYDASLDDAYWQIFSEDVDGEHLYLAECGLNEKIFYNGTFYCREACKEDVTAYYADDAHFDWYVALDDAEGDESLVLMEVTSDEADAVYALDKREKEQSVFFDEIEAMASLMKISQDGLVVGRTGLLKYEDNWYWRTETIDESRERDGEWPEYIQPLPKSLIEKLPR